MNRLDVIAKRFVDKHEFVAWVVLIMCVGSLFAIVGNYLAVLHAEKLRAAKVGCVQRGGSVVEIYSGVSDGFNCVSPKSFNKK